jgi:hypothetical protein
MFLAVIETESTSERRKVAIEEIKWPVSVCLLTGGPGGGGGGISQFHRQQKAILTIFCSLS